jgi:hypothetical protein
MLGRFLGLGGGISVAAVMAAIGFALTASHFRKACAARRKVTKALLPLSFGASPRLGMPSLRSCSVGPPPSAIPGRGRLTRHPCRVAHCAEPALSLSRGRLPPQPPRRPESRPGSLVRAFPHSGYVHRSPVGAGLLAMASVQPIHALTDSPLSSERRPQQAGSYTGIGFTRFKIVGASLLAMDANDNAGCLNERGVWAFFAGKPAPTGIAYAFDFHHSSGRALARLQLLILRYTPPREAEWRFCAVGNPAWMPG